MSDAHQLSLPFDHVFEPEDHPALWTPRDIWVRLSHKLLRYFAEGRRIDYNSGRRVDFEDLAIFYSMFSNTTDGGVLVYGADSDGIPHGCSKMPETTLNKLEHFHFNVCPQAKPEFKRFPVTVENKTDFCVAIYLPYVGKLVETNNGQAWIRYGDRRHEMSGEEVRDFRATREQHAYEVEMASFSYPGEFDFRVIQDFCDAFRDREHHQTWTNEEVLVDRNLGKMLNGKLVPFNNLVLLAASNPRRAIPGCRIRVQRFRQTDGNVGNDYNPIKDQFVEGNLVKMIVAIDALVEETIYPVTWLNKDGKFVTTPEYPRWAWFESVINALVHRSYSFSGSEISIRFYPDRLEIESPGGFVPPVSENTIYHARAARNYHLMDALRFLGYVQMAREGTQRIRSSMKEWGLPDPVFRQEAVHGVIVKVTLWNDHQTRKRSTDLDVANHFGVDVWKKLQDHELKIVAFAFRNKVVQVSEASRLTGRTWHTTKKDLNKLARRGLLSFMPGSYERDPKAHYILQEKENVKL